MNEFVNSLANISSTYTVFEKDQILTESQLNSITSYLDPQERLTRVNLFGVGIVSGLMVSSSGGKVHLDPGVGITTDGDLVCQSERSSFNSFKEYGLEAPKYAPLYKNASTMFPAWELIKVGESGDASKPLNQFNTATGNNIASLICVLLVESYIKDEDFCQLDGCENLGKDRLCKIKLLVMEQSSLGKLRHAFASAKSANEGLQPVANQRVILNSATNTLAKFNNDNRAACTAMHTGLVNLLPLLSRHYSVLISPGVSSATIEKWLEQLKAYANEFQGTTPGIQYYYDFLSDLCSVWNEICMKAPLNMTQPCPDINAFPKHLVLGGLGTSSESLERFEFYPSTRYFGDSSENEFVFLVKKLDAMINGFAGKKVTDGDEIKVTPSLQNPCSSGEGAIPFYYRVLKTRPIHQYWNFSLSQRTRGSLNYGFRSADFGAVGSAANPLLSRIDDFSFFRVEGHIGERLSTVVEQLEQQIIDHALPFTLRTALLGSDRKKLIKKRGLRYNDLHRFHRLVRMDISHQLDEVKSFSDKHQSNITLAINSHIILDDSIENNGAKVSELSRDLNEDIKNKATQAQNTMKLDYIAFKANNSSWQSNIADTMVSAGRYKRDLGKVTKTDFTTPFDGLIDNTRVNWLPWLDSMIDEKESQEDDRMFLSELLKQHPGLDHAAGVPRGGTLVLIYDHSGVVVGDCMSPCCIPEPEVIEQPVEPELPKPPIRPPFIIDKGALLNPSRDLFFKERFSIEKVRIDEKIGQELNIQREVVKTFKDSFSIYSNSLLRPPAKVPGGGRLDVGVVEGKVGIKSAKLNVIGAELAQLNEMLKEANLSVENRKRIERERKENEAVIVKEVLRMAEILSEEKISVKSGSEGGDALIEIESALSRLEGSPQSRKRAIEALRRIQQNTTNQALKVGLGRIVIG